MRRQLAIVGALGLAGCCADPGSHDGRATAVCIVEPSGSATPLPSPTPVTSFVTRAGAELRLDGARFRFAGANAYWLGLDEWKTVAYPTPFRQEDALGMAREMGFTVIRSHTLGISAGRPLSFEPERGVYVDDALAAADHAIAVAQQLGLRYIVPLTDNWRYFHGGRFDFARWRGKSGDDFFTDADIRADFKDYITHLLSHRNRETGVVYKDDPTIMAWELGNELMPSGGPAALRDFSADVALHIKALAPQQLVVDGWAGTSPDAGLLSIPEIDVHTVHLYACHVDKSVVLAAAERVRAADRVFWVGEYDWTAHTPEALGAMLETLYGSDDVQGDLLWNLWPHDDAHGYVVHGERFDFIPPGATPGQEVRIARLRDHAFAMSARPTATWSPPPSPLAAWDAATHALSWRGGGATRRYSVESALGSAGPWTTLCTGCVDDLAPSYAPPTAANWLRLVPIACDGTRGPPSNAVAAME